MNSWKKYSLWAIIVSYLIMTLLFDLSPYSKPELGSIISIGTLFLFSVLHGTTYYRFKDFFAFFIISFLVSNIFENIGVITGFPFGYYHYTDQIGPKLLHVPIIVGFAYFSVGYLSWILAHALLGKYNMILHKGDIFVVPIIASFIMVCWDLVMDPLSSTLGNQWVWHNGGGYFGVPFKNFMGWYLVVYTYTQLFALYLNRFAPHSSEPTNIPPVFWYQACLVYGLIALEYPLLSFVGTNSQIFDKKGTAWWTADMYDSAALISIFTMCFITLLAAIKITREYRHLSTVKVKESK